MITAIVPVYNMPQEWLERCVASLRSWTVALPTTTEECAPADEARTATIGEIIVVDDGSNHGTALLCDAMAERWPEVRVIHKRNEGLGMACNTGLEAALGEYVMFCDADDWVDDCRPVIPHDADVLTGGLREVSASGRCVTLAQYERQTLRSRDAILHVGREMLASTPERRRDRYVAMSAKTAIYRRELLMRHGVRFRSEREFMCEDLLFNLDVMEVAQCVVMCPLVWYNYRSHPNSCSRRYDPLRWHRIGRMYAVLRNRHDGADHDWMLRCMRWLAGYSRQAVVKIATTRGIPLRVRWRLLREIASDEVWQEFDAVYPIGKMPLRHRVALPYLLKKMSR